MQRILERNESKEENQREWCHGPNKVESFRKSRVVTISNDTAKHESGT